MLKGKVAIVTGSTSGIGLGIATALAQQGADVMLNGFGDRAAIDRTVQQLAERHGVRTAYSPADMSKSAAVAALVAETGTTLGPVDIMVNNAGIQHVAQVEDFPDDRWNAVIAINLSAAFHAAKAALPAMKQRKWGRIINIASAHGLVASGGKSAYVAAKHGLIGLTKVIAIEAADDGITCNAICPGWVMTPLVQQQIEARAKAANKTVEAATEEMLREKQPMLQFTTPEKIGALAVFLCGDGASTITGAALPIDGGWTAQ
ncbi:MAG TPA: 3-hydroxybutyrate dehydrogenase [Acetobacteraceae bacterium]|jgi:3-hydroxybutyrate dehydrogenase|nr:3-hydroxybutyrate dehydrogenase [Acetobacteraceae bacterium]